METDSDDDRDGPRWSDRTVTCLFGHNRTETRPTRTSGDPVSGQRCGGPRHRDSGDQDRGRKRGVGHKGRLGRERAFGPQGGVEPKILGLPKTLSFSLFLLSPDTGDDEVHMVLVVPSSREGGRIQSPPLSLEGMSGLYTVPSLFVGLEDLLSVSPDWGREFCVRAGGCPDSRPWKGRVLRGSTDPLRPSDR